jgi:hypothetical protein
MPAQEINLPDLMHLADDDPRWSLPAVAFLRDGSIVRLGSRSLRQANDEVTQAGDNDFHLDNPRIMADALRNLGVVLPDGEEPSSTQQASPDAAAAGLQTADRWVDVYVAACGEVLAAANACLEVANRAVGARSKIAEHRNDGLPGTPIAIRNFTSWAEEAEREFASLHRTFAEACSNARETAASFLAAGDNEQQAEVVLMLKLDKSVLDNVATVKAILHANYGANPAAFIQGVQESNQLMENPTDDGNIFRPLAAAQSDERTCPWCAETIKAAAVICRFCGRDVQVQPNAG